MDFLFFFSLYLNRTTLFLRLAHFDALLNIDTVYLVALQESGRQQTRAQIYKIRSPYKTSETNFELQTMPRRSSRPAPASPEAPGAASGAAPKRRASARLSASQGEVKRIKSNADLSGVKSTTKKSKYFEPDSSAEPEDGESDGDSGSAYEEQEQQEDPESSDHQSEPEEPSDSENERKTAKGKQSPKATSDAHALKGKELWREGVRTGLGPGKEVFIPKPKARDAGNVAYEDETLHPNTKLFLQDLAQNNEREWFKGNSVLRPIKRGYRS